jgi:hypothetical protein
MRDELRGTETIFLHGESYNYRRRGGVPPGIYLKALKLEDDLFTSTLLKHGFDQKMTFVEDFPHGHFYYINASGIQHIHENKSVRQSMLTIAYGLISPGTPLASFKNNVLFDKNLLFLIRDFF